MINSLLERLDLAFRAQKRLIADAAHELKTPTAVLVGEAQEALRQDATPEERRESVETIERVARGLAREVDALLLLARGDAATPSLRATLDLAALAADAVEATEPLGGPRSVEVVFRRLSSAWVCGEAASLQRVAANLVSNAVLYTAPGTTVEVTAGSDGAEVFVLGRMEFLDLVLHSDLVCSEMARLLQKRMAIQRLVEALPRLRANDAERLLPEFRPQTFAASSIIMREGDPAEHFYVLLDGEVSVTCAGTDGAMEPLATLRLGQYFGEAGLLSGMPRNATISVSSGGPATVLIADKAGFQEMLRETGGLRGNLAQAMLRRLGGRSN